MSAAPARLAKALIAITDGDPGALVGLAAVAGVSGYQARRAARQIAVSADAYLKLCAAAAIDPVTGAHAPAKETSLPLPDLDWNRVAIKVLLALIGSPRSPKLSIRAASKKWNIPVVTLARAKAEQPVGIENLLKLCRALGCHPHDFLKRQPPAFHGEQQPERVEMIGSGA